MAKKRVRDILKKIKDTEDYAVFLDSLAQALDSDHELNDHIKNVLNDLMPAGVLRGAATTLREHGALLEESVGNLEVDWTLSVKEGK